MEDTAEVWKVIDGFEDYHVSNLGRVKSFKYDINGVILNIFSDNKGKGYMRVNLLNKYGRKLKQVHRLVAEAFIPNPKNKPQVNHIDGDTKNNHVENLEWCTASENEKHSYALLGKKGKIGIKNPLAKLTEEQVIDIYILAKKEIFTQKVIAEKYNIAAPTVSLIKTGKLWYHLTCGIDV